MGIDRVTTTSAAPQEYDHSNGPRTGVAAHHRPRIGHDFGCGSVLTPVKLYGMVLQAGAAELKARVLCSPAHGAREQAMYFGPHTRRGCFCVAVVGGLPNPTLRRGIRSTRADAGALRTHRYNSSV